MFSMLPTFEGLEIGEGRRGELVVESMVYFWGGTRGGKAAICTPVYTGTRCQYRQRKPVSPPAEIIALAYQPNPGQVATLLLILRARNLSKHPLCRQRMERELQ
jgi:hypothetical protein